MYFLKKGWVGDRIIVIGSQKDHLRGRISGYRSYALRIGLPQLRQPFDFRRTVRQGVEELFGGHEFPHDAMDGACPAACPANHDSLLANLCASDLVTNGRWLAL